MVNIVAVISNLYVDVCAFSRHYSIFSRNPKCPGQYPWGCTYPRLGITVLDQLSAKKILILLQSNCYLLENKLKKNVMYLCYIYLLVPDISACTRYICMYQIYLLVPDISACTRYICLYQIYLLVPDISVCSVFLAIIS
jgi:hypothetical protein